MLNETDWRTSGTTRYARQAPAWVVEFEESVNFCVKEEMRLVSTTWRMDESCNSPEDIMDPRVSQLPDFQERRGSRH